MCSISLKRTSDKNIAMECQNSFDYNFNFKTVVYNRIFNVTLNCLIVRILYQHLYYPKPLTSEQDFSLSGTSLFSFNQNALFYDH